MPIIIFWGNKQYNGCRLAAKMDKIQYTHLVA